MTRDDGTQSEASTEGGWAAFRAAGLLWWVNRSLHLFGWAIVLTVDDTNEEVISATPERVLYRGFGRDAEEKGFEALTMHLNKSAISLMRDLFPSEIEAKDPDSGKTFTTGPGVPPYEFSPDYLTGTIDGRSLTVGRYSGDVNFDGDIIGNAPISLEDDALWAKAVYIYRVAL